MDLYRLPGNSSKELEALALPHVFSRCISLIEWPGILTKFPQVSLSNENLLDVKITISHLSEERIITLTADENSTWRNRLQYLIDEGMVEDLLMEEGTDAAS
jgi:tRNA A37 threonylcarbamoyladenosine biosynthesis protein TsaE